jgi:tetratricopeptide (TPR) repeat protein
LIYGDSLVANGQPERAAEVTRNISWAEGRFMYQAHYLYARDQDYTRALDAWSAALKLNPENTAAVKNLEILRKKLNP